MSNQENVIRGALFSSSLRRFATLTRARILATPALANCENKSNSCQIISSHLVICQIDDQQLDQFKCPSFNCKTWKYQFFYDAWKYLPKALSFPFSLCLYALVLYCIVFHFEKNLNSHFYIIFTFSHIIINFSLYMFSSWTPGTTIVCWQIA